MSATDILNESKNDLAIAELQAKAVELYRQHESNRRELGETLMKIKRGLGHGNFTAWWKAKGFDQNTVSYCLRIAQGKVDKAKRKSKNVQRRNAMKKVTATFRKLYATRSEY